MARSPIHEVTSSRCSGSVLQCTHQTCSSGLSSAISPCEESPVSLAEPCIPSANSARSCHHPHFPRPLSRLSAPYNAWYKRSISVIWLDENTLARSRRVLCECGCVRMCMFTEYDCLRKTLPIHISHLTSRLPVSACGDITLTDTKSLCF